ncbi:hypothetical protein [Paraclostridium dentum]|uniref:hypothetical protein n=1 Tax=Paraclostridium dentum TaxID=2662455 RepID=UPI003F6794E8
MSLLIKAMDGGTNSLSAPGLMKRFSVSIKTVSNNVTVTCNTTVTRNVEEQKVEILALRWSEVKVKVAIIKST